MGSNHTEQLQRLSQVSLASCLFQSQPKLTQLGYIGSSQIWSLVIHHQKNGEMRERIKQIHRTETKWKLIKKLAASVLYSNKQRQGISMDGSWNQLTTGIERNYERKEINNGTLNLKMEAPSSL